MDAKAFPPRPNIEQYRKQAKDLLRAARDGDPRALARIAVSPRIHASDPATKCNLSDAQYAVAREHGFESWPRFSAHVTSLAQPDGPAARFEAAADAVVNGDLTALDSMLRADTQLARARSSRQHRATLMHYLSANGVEDFRQKTAANAIPVAEMLLDAGADVDATAETYGGGATQTTLNLLVSSVHPARVGLQVALANTLIDRGAALDGIGGDGSPLLTALAFHYPAAAEAIAHRGARSDSILAAAGLGHVDTVRRLVDRSGALGQDAALPDVPWLHLPRDPRAHLQRALIWAATLGRAPVVEFLSKQRVDLAAIDHQGFTALHWAATYGQLDVIEILLAHDAPLEATNTYGATPLGAAVWASAHSEGVFRESGVEPVDHARVVERLMQAGARIEAAGYPSGIGPMDTVLRRHGAKPSS